VERAITCAGAGATILEAKPLPGSDGTESGSVKRRVRSESGVGFWTPKPSGVFGSTLVPSQEGGTVPRGGRADTGAEGEAERPGVRLGWTLGVSWCDGGGAVSGADDAHPETASSRLENNTDARTPRDYRRACTPR
jgi:hypothetical protein